MTRKQFIKEFKAHHPVARCLHSGLWGYERRYDCLNLNRCIYTTKRAAEMARGRDAEARAACALNPEP